MTLSRLLFVAIPGEGGVFDYVCELVAHLKRYHPGITIDLAYSSKRGGGRLESLIQAIKAGGGKVIDLKVTNAPQILDLLALWKVMQMVRSGNVQLIHAHSAKAGLLCRILRCLLPGCPSVIYTPHAYFGLAGTKKLTAAVFNGIEGTLGRRGFTINCSLDERNFALKKLHLPAKKLILVHHGIDLTRFRRPTDVERRTNRERFGFSESDIVLISVGRHAHQKNYQPLYRALDSILCHEEQRYRFVHAGKSSEDLRDQLSAGAQEKCGNFSFLHPIEPLFYAADAFILTSRYEGLSLSVLQALACGLKLFLTRVPGNQCLQSMGFQDIEWIEPCEDYSLLSQRIAQALLQWSLQATPPGPDQVLRAGHKFAVKDQCEKIFKIYNYSMKLP